MSTYPENLLYTKQHEWVRKEGGGIVTVGITEFAQAELGELVFVDLPKVGKAVTAGGVACVVESTKAASDVYAPVSGEVIEHNSALSSDPALVNREPYANGWLLKLKNVSESEYAALLTSAQYTQLVSAK